MSGRRLVWPLIVLLGVALFFTARRAEERLRGSRQLNTAEAITLQTSLQGRVDGRVLQRSLEILRQTEKLLPTEVAVPVARGGQYLLLQRPKAAIRAYRQALDFERRGEIYANLGRALVLAGELEKARNAFRVAVLLDHNLAPALQQERERLLALSRAGATKP